MLQNNIYNTRCAGTELQFQHTGDKGHKFKVILHTSQVRSYPEIHKILLKKKKKKKTVS